MTLDLKKNEIIENVKIQDILNDGFGVAKIDGFVLFIPNAAVGDICKVQIIKLKKEYGYGRIVEITQKSPSRIDSDCGVYSKCGGCVFRHISYAEELRLKQKFVEDAVKRISGLDLKCEKIIPAENILRYRNKAVIPIGQENGQNIFGFYRKHSHDIISIKDCLLQKEQIGGIVQSVVNYMKKTGEQAFDEKRQSGNIRRVFIRTSEFTGQSVVAVVTYRNRLKNEELLVDEILSNCPNIAGIVQNINNSKGNKALGEANKILFGEDKVTERICGIDFDVSVQSFFQVNTRQAEKLYSAAIELAEIDVRKNVLDLYCGTGSISLCCAKHAKYVVGVEIVREAVNNAVENARKNNITNARFICGDAGKVAEKLLLGGFLPDIIMVDPPRKGLDNNAIDVICRCLPEKLVYISCNPATMARDIKIMAEKGFIPQKMLAVDMFPRTGHVETVVLMTRVER